MEPRSSDVELIRSFLHDRSIGCPVCAYNLRGASGDSCPECGAKLNLQLCTIDLRLGLWLIGLLAVALPMGFTGTMAALASFGAWRATYWFERDWWLFGALWGATAFYGLCLCGVIRRRSKFLQMSRLEQRVRAWGLAIAMLSLQVLSLYLFRHFNSF